MSDPPPEDGVFQSKEGVFPPEEGMYVQPSPTHVSEPFPPYLQRDRRSMVRLSAWRAPSFDESLGSLLLGRANRQILLFSLGFIFPLGESQWNVRQQHTGAYRYHSVDNCCLPPTAHSK